MEGDEHDRFGNNNPRTDFSLGARVDAWRLPHLGPASFPAALIEKAAELQSQVDSAPDRSLRAPDVERQL